MGDTFQKFVDSMDESTFLEFYDWVLAHKSLVANLDLFAKETLQRRFRGIQLDKVLKTKE